MTRTLIGVPAAPGLASGPAYILAHQNMRATRQEVDDVSAELERLDAAVNQADGELSELTKRSAKQVGNDEAAIFAAQRTMLRDPELQGRVRKHVQTERVNVEFAWQDGIECAAAALRGTGDATIAARAADVEDIGRRVLSRLLGQAADIPKLDGAAIIVADDLAPADTVIFDRSLVLGFCTQGGGPTAHAAILAKSLGVPCVVGMSTELRDIQRGASLILDGEKGELIVEPDARMVSEYRAMAQDRLDHRREALQASVLPARTADGQRVEVVANVGSDADAAEAISNGAEGIGLLRTEFLFLDRLAAPDKDEQIKAYTRIFEVIGPSKPIVVRTLDIGGDKPAGYLDMPHETNPFLGVRGIRLSLKHADLFEQQLRALLIAGQGYDLRIMFPMVASLEEIFQAREVLRRCQAALVAECRPHCERPQIGIMVEVPSAAVLADVLAPSVDFFSIGTNDLSQYTLAADRSSAQVSQLADALHPAVLHLIRQVIQAAHAHGKWAGVCGELAGETLATPILLGLGLDEFSASPRLIPDLKKTIGSFRRDKAREVAEHALACSNADAVRTYMRTVLRDAGGGKNAR